MGTEITPQANLWRGCRYHLKRNPEGSFIEIDPNPTRGLDKLALWFVAAKLFAIADIQSVILKDLRLSNWIFVSAMEPEVIFYYNAGHNALNKVYVNFRDISLEPLSEYNTIVNKKLSLNSAHLYFLVFTSLLQSVICALDCFLLSSRIDSNALW